MCVQRLKGAIDSRIAEEQARAKAGTSTAGAPTISRSNSARTESPTKRTRPKTKVVDDGLRGPDPSEFEAAFVIEDDDETPGSTRIGTPVPTEKRESAIMAGGGSPAPAAAHNADILSEKPDRAPAPPSATSTPELPVEVRQKLRKLEKLETRYQELLRSYRIAHARAVSIEPFEKTLKENTPLVSISEPEALVEYLNQLNLRGDMVMEELKRVTSDRDLYKKKFEQADREASDAQAELESLKSSAKADESAESAQSFSDVPDQAVTAELKSPPDAKSPVSSVLSIFSPKQKPESPTEGDKDVNEEFFSYDEEIPQLQSELKAKTAEIESLKSEVETLQKDLDAFKETNVGLSGTVQSLEQQLNGARDTGSKASSEQQEELQQLQGKLDATTKSMEDLQKRITEQEKEGTEMASSKAAELEKSQVTIDKLRQELKDLQSLQEGGQKKIKLLESEIAALTKKMEDDKITAKEAPAKNKIEQATTTAPTATVAESSAPTSASAKKRNKKKKKGANASKDTPVAATDETQEPEETPAPEISSDELQAEIESLKAEVAARDVQIEKLQKQQKNEEVLREKIAELEENYLEVGHEHVEAKEKIKELQEEKKSLQEKVDALETTIATQMGHQEKAGKAEANLETMTSEHEELKIKLSTLQSNLGAAEKLATSRYKELTDLRDVLQKAQPELRTLRTENANLKATKDELSARTGELRRLEARERDLKADVASFKKQAVDRDAELKTLNEKVTQETNGRLKAEDQGRIVGRDLRRSEAEKIEISATGEKAARELSRVQDEAAKLRTKVRDLEGQVIKLTNENQGFRQEIDLKASQYSSAQGLVGSMRDQTAEMAMQLKEAKEQSESLEEELVEVQRLLTERTREGETMRRLLQDMDDRADAKVREMRERMEAAIEERDKAEDEASTNGRRRAREIDDLKNKIRDLERDVKRAIDDKDELERSEKDFRRRRDELEKTSEHAGKEVADIRTAMDELRAALDGSEKQAREAEKNKADLRRLLDEANQKYEKLHKALKVKEQRLAELSSGPSHRTSSDLGSRVGSPSRGINGAANGVNEYVYLKTVLLQFFEQKDKKLQTQLVPVLGKLLHFDS